MNVVGELTVSISIPVSPLVVMPVVVFEVVEHVSKEGTAASGLNVFYFTYEIVFSEGIKEVVIKHFNSVLISFEMTLSDFYLSWDAEKCDS